MKIAAVQLRSVSGDLRANLARHVTALETAARLGAELDATSEGMVLLDTQCGQARTFGLP